MFSKKIWFGSAFVIVTILSFNLQAEPDPNHSASTPPPSENQAATPNEGHSGNLEDLLWMDITSVYKTESKWTDTAAAVSVITSEDLRRSGVTNIPDALRMVPGVEVAQINEHTWAISIRGFNSDFSNKLLVLIDGRSVYTPQFGGVYWDMHDVMLEDVERIEVIRGPGGSLWGSNAVNGIINIITKKAGDTPGVLATGGGGNKEQGFGAARYGGKINQDTTFRVYSKYFNRDGGPIVGQDQRGDEWSKLQGGGRLDWEKGDNQVTFQGDAYQAKLGTTEGLYSLYHMPTNYEGAYNAQGGNVLGRWKHTISDTSDTELQVYFDRNRRPTPAYSETINTLDFDFQHRFALGERQEITWGLGHRYIDDYIKAGTYTVVFPEHRDRHLYSSFVQDVVKLMENKLQLIAGCKFEYYDFTAFEYQPSARLVWTPNENHTLWGAVNRAVRMPSRFDHDGFMEYRISNFGPGGRPMTMAIIGNPDASSEEVMTYEAGYRIRPVEPVYLDVTGFFNDYSNLMTRERGATRILTRPINRTLIPLTVDNRMYGETYGVEFMGTWQVTKDWRLSSGYTFFQTQMHVKDNSSNESGAIAREGTSAHNRFSARSSFNLAKNLELDTTIYYVDNLPYIDIPPYWRWDMRLGWHIRENLEFSVVVQNLQDNRHQEFYNWLSALSGTEVERSYYAQLKLEF